MKAIFVSIAAAGLMVAGGAIATDMPELAKKNGCAVCHTINKRMIGPAWMDVANKYKDTAGAEARLIAKVSNGGGGVWGRVPMPALDPSGKKQDDIKQLVQFILALAK